MYIVYIADNFHSLDSQEVIGLATTKANAVRIIKRYNSENELPKLTKEEVQFFLEYLQTQRGHNISETEFRIKKVELNCLIH